jgi:hypothetical protein
MIINIPNVGMNYVNYKTSIVQKYHVQLLGWPSDIPFINPHQLTTIAAARTLLNALTVSTCKWVAMSKRQRQEHSATLAADVEGGQAVGKKRKVRSDKGKKRKRTPVDSDNDDSSEEEDETNDENEQPTPAKKRKSAASTKRPKGPAIRSKAATTSKASASKKARRVTGILPPTAPKSNEFIDTDDDFDD